MNNDLVNEISNYRGERLVSLGTISITKEVSAAIDTIAPGAMNGLQGLSAEEDGITAPLWRQAVRSAEMDGSLTFPEHRDDSGIPPEAEVVSLELAKKVIAGRVARAILHLDGLISPFMESEPGSWPGGPEGSLDPKAYYYM